ncbi:MAG: hypothetical protein AMXMBFR61_06190 [Fimbriimonadales bacterium]
MHRQDRYLTVVLSGAAGEPCEELDGKTPLQAAPTPHLDALAAEAEVGCAELPETADPSRPETSIAVLLGVEPTSLPHGPLLAAAMEFRPEEQDVCFRCEFVATDGDTLLGPTGALPEQQERALVGLVQEKLSTRRLRVIPGNGSPHLLLWTDGPRDLECCPPELARGLPLRRALPRGDGEEVLRRFVDDCLNLLYGHPVNRARAGEGLPPANLLWPYENGTLPKLRPFGIEWGMTAGLVAAVPEVRGLGCLLGMHVADPGRVETDYDAALAQCLNLLQSHRFVLLHVPSCRAARNRGDATEVAYTLRDMDTRLIAPLRELQAASRLCLMLVCDEAKRSRAPMLYLLSPRKAMSVQPPFDERLAAEDGVARLAAAALLSKLLKPTSLLSDL